MSVEHFTFTDGSKLIASGARWFVGQTVWEANRTLDPDHAADLERSITDPTTIQGPFTLVTYPNDEGIVQLRIIDGQHRQEVLRRYFAANPTADDFQVLVRRYQIANYDELAPGCNRPALSTENLEKALKLYGIHQRTDLTPDDVVGHAKAYNTWVSADPTTRIQTRVTQTILDGAIKDKFFLGLDSNCTWLMDLRRA